LALRGAELSGGFEKREKADRVTAQALDFKSSVDTERARSCLVDLRRVLGDTLQGLQPGECVGDFVLGKTCGGKFAGQCIRICAGVKGAVVFEQIDEDIEHLHPLYCRRVQVSKTKWASTSISGIDCRVDAQHIGPAPVRAASRSGCRRRSRSASPARRVPPD